MRSTLYQLSNAAVLDRTDEVLARERGTTAELLVCLGELDSRRLYAPQGYSSMFRWCVDAKNMSPDEAYKRIRAARAARRFPSILDAVAGGRLHLTAVVLLAPYLNRHNADELLSAAIHKTKEEVLEIIAQKFPLPDVPTRIVPLVATPSALGAGQIHSMPLVPEPVHEVALAELPVAFRDGSPARVTPLAPERFWIQETIDQETHDLLRRAQELLGRQISPGDVAPVLKRALKLLVTQLEKQKRATTDRPQAQKSRLGNDPRYIPNAVKREVARRDGDQCTFVSESGHRCEERSGLEYDHIDPVARGGTATIRNIRLRCRAHNQYEAEKIYGAGFMEAKRGAAG